LAFARHLSTTPIGAVSAWTATIRTCSPPTPKAAPALPSSPPDGDYSPISVASPPSPARPTGRIHATPGVVELEPTVGSIRLQPSTRS
jgi:hypothetical protein